MKAKTQRQIHAEVIFLLFKYIRKYEREIKRLKKLLAKRKDVRP